MEHYCFCPPHFHFIEHNTDNGGIIRHSPPYWCPSIVHPEYYLLRNKFFAEGTNMILPQHCIIFPHVFTDLLWCARNNHGIIEIDSIFRNAQNPFINGYIIMEFVFTMV